MKLVFVGGGTGGHFYPLIAVAEEIDAYAQEHQLVQPKKYYFGPEKYDEKALYSAGLKYHYCSAGKLRRTKDIASRIKNIFSIFAMGVGVVKVVVNLFIIFPDVVFSKGGYAAFPVLVAARILRIPVIVHESDATFGRVNRWSAKFARYIAISYPEVEQELNKQQKEKTAFVGIPLRKTLLPRPTEKAEELLKLEEGIPVLAVFGGSSGAQYVNDNIIDALPELLQHYQVVHITGVGHIESVVQESKSFLRDKGGLHTYRPIAQLNAYYLRALYSIAKLAITRAGSGTLFELSAWGIPSIIIPIPEEVSHDQRKNAYAYIRSAGGIVIEEKNLSPNLLISQIEKLLKNEQGYADLKRRTEAFAKLDAGKKIAQLLVKILKEHET